MMLLVDTHAYSTLLPGHTDVARRMRGGDCAQAMESGAELLSFDHHFAEVDGLAWVEPLEQ